MSGKFNHKQFRHLAKKPLFDERLPLVADGERWTGVSSGGYDRSPVAPLLYWTTVQTIPNVISVAKRKATPTRQSSACHREAVSEKLSRSAMSEIGRLHVSAVILLLIHLHFRCQLDRSCKDICWWSEQTLGEAGILLCLCIRACRVEAFALAPVSGTNFISLNFDNELCTFFFFFFM